MRLNLKLGIVGVAAALLVAFAAFGLGGPANAEVTGAGNGVWVEAEQGIDPAVGTTAPQEDCAAGTVASLGAISAKGAVTAPAAVNTTNFPNLSSLPTATLPQIILPTSGSVILCVNADDGDGQLSFDANNATDVGATGAFTRPSCSFSTIRGGVAHDGDARVAEWPDDSCQDPTGVATGHLIIPDSTAQCSEIAGACNNDLDVAMVVYTCPSVASTVTITIGQDQSQVRFQILCLGQPGGITITASPATVEIVPAPSNTAHSLILVTATDAAGNPILVSPNAEVDFSVNVGTLLGTGPLGGCAIETAPFAVSAVTGVTNAIGSSNISLARQINAQLSTAQPSSFIAWDDFANEGGFNSISEGSLFFPDLTPTTDLGTFVITETTATVLRSQAAAILHCDVHPGVTNPVPGNVVVQACVDVIGASDICRQVTVTVVGPPASITVAASPTSVRCGEKSQITVTVKDAVGQNVSDHTLVELVSNLGGTIGGTGAVASFAGPVVPISSSVAGTFGGVATAFLLTSDAHEGPYEVVATTGGTAPGDGGFISNGLFDNELTFDFSEATPRQTTLGGIFSTPPISAEVTVTCSLPAPTAAAPAATVTAPRTGTGVLPPNTGDAGLRNSSSSSWTLFALGGLAAFALAGLATIKFARR